MSVRLTAYRRLACAASAAAALLFVLAACGPSSAHPAERPVDEATQSPSVQQSSLHRDAPGDVPSATEGLMDEEVGVGRTAADPTSAELPGSKGVRDSGLERLVEAICDDVPETAASLNERIRSYVRGQEQDALATGQRVVAERAVELVEHVARKWPVGRDDEGFRSVLSLVSGLLLEDLTQARSEMTAQIESHRTRLQGLQEQIAKLERMNRSGQAEEVVRTIRGRADSVLNIVQELGEAIARYDLRLGDLRSHLELLEQSSELDLSFEEIRLGLVEQLQAIVLGQPR